MSSQDEDTLNEALQILQQLVEQQRWPDAYQLATNVLNIAPDDLYANYLGGLASFNAGRLDEAEALFSRLVELAPSLTEAHKNLAVVAMWRSNPDLGLACQATACELAPDDLGAATTLATWRLLFGDIEGRRKALSDALGTAPQDVSLNCIYDALLAGASTRIAQPTEKRVAIISDDPRIREAKMGRAARLQGWSPILFCHNLPKYDPLEYFDEVIQYAGPWDAVIKATAYRPEVYHCLAQMKYQTCAAFLAADPGLVLCDMYDHVDLLSDDFFSREPGRRFDAALERSVMAPSI